jgi:hypothetical protein
MGAADSGGERLPLLLARGGPEHPPRLRLIEAVESVQAVGLGIRQRQRCGAERVLRTAATIPPIA